MAKDKDHGNLRVLVTSVDGNADHPFRADQTVLEVREWAYNQLVKDKRETPVTNTWIEHRGNRLEDETELNAVDREPGKTGKDPDLILSLSWTSQGG